MSPAERAAVPRRGSHLARRRELAGAALGAGAALAAGRWLAAAAPAWADEHSPLRAVVAVEQSVALAYQLALARPGLDKPTRALLRTLHVHERRHADALSRLLPQSQERVPAGPRRLADVDRYLPGLGAARSSTEILAFAVDLETVALARQANVQRLLADARTIQTVASIMAAEGQHLVALRSALGRAPLPEALETGTDTPRRSAAGIP